MAVAVCEAGGLGSLPCAMLSADRIRAELGDIRSRTAGPINLNFFCHAPVPVKPEVDERWRSLLAPFYAELGIEQASPAGGVGRAPFDAAMCQLVEEERPNVVSFHFGLPAADLVDRVKRTGACVIASATSVAEARWLEARGCDAIIAQGSEAGGHRGIFLTDSVASQPGTLALVPQVVDAVAVPVIAAGGIGDGRGVAAAFALGAAGVQMGTAYLLSPEATISDLHRQALRGAVDDATALTNVFTGRPARSVVNRLMREIGPISDAAPPFPGAAAALAPLRARAEALGKADFTSLWSGQAARLCAEEGAREITTRIAADALQWLRRLADG